jgi:anti-sigma-K factor RskA
VVLGAGWWQAYQAPPQVIRETVVDRVVERVTEEVAIALLAGDDGGAQWLARIALATGELAVRTVSPPEQVTDRDYQLWALTDAGVPVSLGLLPKQGEQASTLDDRARQALLTSTTLAVSLEPKGGSPKDVPTGPVLYTASIFGP